MRSFAYSGQAGRVVFGAGTPRELPTEVERLGGTRVLLIASGPLADAAGGHLGSLPVARFTAAAMHTPVDVTARALEMPRGPRPPSCRRPSSTTSS